MTPQTITFAARGLLVGLAAADALVPHDLVTSGTSSFALGYVGTLAGLLAFPGIRRNDVLAALGAGLALRALLPAFSTGQLDMAAWIGGIAGLGLAVAPLAVAHARRLAGSNPYMHLADWRQAERRRRGDAERPMAMTPRLIQHP